MKRNILVLLCLMLASSVYAQTLGYDANEDIKKTIPFGIAIGGRGADSVIRDKRGRTVCLVGKVIVKYDGDIDRVKERRDMGKKFIGKENVYQPIGFADKTLYSEGEVFFGAVPLPKSGENVISSDTESVADNNGYVLMTYGYMTYYFNGSGKMKLILPLSYNIQVPEDEKFLYIGTLVYEFEGDLFTLKGITIVDEYDEAQKELNRITKSDKYRLCRVDLNP